MSQPVVNFGGNVRFTPRHNYAPRTEAEVLEILDRHAGGRVRVMASLHSWSDVVPCDDALIDMRHFNEVRVERGEDGELWATVGAGCKLKDLLPALAAQGGVTLPSLGAVTQQTLAGVVSTATHGSGRHSLSHYMAELRVAAYDPESGKARIYDWRQGTELAAARCGLGATGVLLALRFRCSREYLVEETVRRYDTLAEVLAAEAEHPLQQFVLVPYLWSYFNFERRPLRRPEGWRPGLGVRLYRAYNLIVIDVLFHLMVKLFLKLGGAAVRFFFRHFLAPTILRGRAVADESHEILTMEHELFRHEEMEVFVPARHLEAAVALVRHVVSTCAGTAGEASGEVAAALEEAGMTDEVAALAGTYTHHYPLFFRRVLPDEGVLISMTGGAEEPYYTVSFFTYLAPAAREPFYRMAALLARALTRLYGARLHWGKHYPLEHGEIAHLYPRLDEFRRACDAVDPRGVFRNDYTTRVLGLAAGAASPEED